MKIITTLAASALALSGATAFGAPAAKPAKPAKSGASCTVIAATGSGPTKAIAEIMANGGVKTIANSRGYTPEGPVKMKCTDGTFLTECTAQSKVCK